MLIFSFFYSRYFVLYACCLAPVGLLQPLKFALWLRNFCCGRRSAASEASQEVLLLARVKKVKGLASFAFLLMFCLILRSWGDIYAPGGLWSLCGARHRLSQLLGFLPVCPEILEKQKSCLAQPQKASLGFSSAKCPALPLILQSRLTWPPAACGLLFLKMWVGSWDRPSGPSLGVCEAGWPAACRGLQFLFPGGRGPPSVFWKVGVWGPGFVRAILIPPPTPLGPHRASVCVLGCSPMLGQRHQVRPKGLSAGHNWTSGPGWGGPLGAQLLWASTVPMGSSLWSQQDLAACLSGGPRWASCRGLSGCRSQAREHLGIATLH